MTATSARSLKKGTRFFSCFLLKNKNILIFFHFLFNFALVIGQKMCYTVAKENMEVFQNENKRTTQKVCKTVFY